MREALNRWLKKQNVSLSADTAHSLCNSLGLDGERVDECLGLVYQFEKGDIDQADFTGGLCVLTGKEPEEVAEVLGGMKTVPSSGFHPPEVKQWLDRWVWAEKKGEIPLIPLKEVVEYLSRFKPKHPVLLYRCQLKDEPPGKVLVSYTHNKEMAESMAETNRELTGKEHIVVTDVISPKKILVDFTMLPEYPEEYIDEVVVIRGEI